MTKPLENIFTPSRAYVIVLQLLRNLSQTEKKKFHLLTSLDPQYETFTTIMLKPTLLR